jgi:hypothetical protein
MKMSRPTLPESALVDYMEVAGWVEPDPTAGDPVGGPIRRITPRGLQVLREV